MLSMLASPNYLVLVCHFFSMYLLLDVFLLTTLVIGGQHVQQGRVRPGCQLASDA